MSGLSCTRKGYATKASPAVKPRYLPGWLRERLTVKLQRSSGQARALCKSIWNTSSRNLASRHALPLRCGPGKKAGHCFVDCHQSSQIEGSCRTIRQIPEDMIEGNLKWLQHFGSSARCITQFGSYGLQLSANRTFFFCVFPFWRPLSIVRGVLTGFSP